MREDLAIIRSRRVGAVVLTRGGNGARARRRILLVSYHFPPDPTVGARRWERFAPFVAERGWGLDVITCAPTGECDLKRLEALPDGVRLFGVPKVKLAAERLEFLAWSAYRGVDGLLNGKNGKRGDFATHEERSGNSTQSDLVERSEVSWRLYSRRGLLRAYWSWLECARYLAWAHRATASARTIFEPGVHFAVVTSGPPHLTHEVGRKISQRTGLPYVMDMRDPWSLSEKVHESLASPLWFRLARRYERAAVRQASLIVANTDAAREALAAAYPEARKRIITVMNGSDDYPLPPSRHGHRFTIAYAGTIYGERHPRSLFGAAARVIRGLGLTPSEFGIEFMGGAAPEQQSLLALADEEGIGGFVSVRPLRPHGEALEFLSSAPMLVTFPGWDTSTVPAKIFEYVRFDAWLLALVDPGSAAERILRGSGADVLASDDTEAIATAIERRYREYRGGARPVRVVGDDRFSRRRQAEILLEAISRLSVALESGRPQHAAAEQRNQ